jgi:hypothetical protein
MKMNYIFLNGKLLKKSNKLLSEDKIELIEKKLKNQCLMIKFSTKDLDKLRSYRLTMPEKDIDNTHSYLISTEILSKSLVQKIIERNFGGLIFEVCK